MLRAIGFGQQYEIASNLTADDYLDYCAKSDVLVTNKQRALCRSHWKVMQIVARGLRMAIEECQFRFANNRWNCSLGANLNYKIQASNLNENNLNTQQQHGINSLIQRRSTVIAPSNTVNDHKASALKQTVFGDVMKYRKFAMD